jgi:hypothetical protein
MSTFFFELENRAGICYSSISDGRNQTGNHYIIHNAQACNTLECWNIGKLEYWAINRDQINS